MSYHQELQTLVERAVKHLHGDRNPYRVTSYIGNLEGVSYTGIMEDIKTILGVASRSVVEDESLWEETPQRKPRTVHKGKLPL